jgi:hypothetical protein
LCEVAEWWASLLLLLLLLLPLVPVLACLLLSLPLLETRNEVANFLLLPLLSRAVAEEVAAADGLTKCGLASGYWLVCALDGKIS